VQVVHEKDERLMRSKEREKDGHGLEETAAAG
jgi:hypothetical protein